MKKTTISINISLLLELGIDKESADKFMDEFKKRLGEGGNEFS